MDEYSESFDAASWEPNPKDLRKDGTPKGKGWMGVLPVKYPDGKTGVATEYSIGVNIGGKPVDIPSIIPTLAPEELDVMLKDVIPNRKPVPEGIMKKAVDHATGRIMKGLSPYRD